MSNNNKKESNIVEFAKLEFNSFVSGQGTLREYDSYYELCLVEDYEELYDDFQCHSIQLVDVFIQLLEVNRQVMLVSIEFTKDGFTLSDIANWLHLNHVGLYNKKFKEIIVKNARCILEGIRFKGNTLIIYQKGKESIKLDVDSYYELTESYQVNLQTIDTAKSIKVKEFN